ncbi:MAG: DUF4236 domain-containing protein [Patescibacteria group bacterium]
MRFQRRIRLGRNLRLNLSGNGIGVSFGIPGLSISIGRKGIFLNTGIPGTGISSRKKLTAEKRKKK